METDAGVSAPVGELSARLAAVGGVLGVPVVVTGDERWEVVDGTLRVGLGWYLSRGHGAAEAVALAMLHLWEGPRGERVAAARARRARSIAEQRPAVAPLLDAVLRVQSAGELLRAMPGVRGPLAAALTRGMPGDLGVLPRHLQWVALVLWFGVAERADQRVAAAVGTLDAGVAEELARLSVLGGAGVDPVRRVLAPDPSRSALQRFERALALLLPPYERLLARDAAERGLGQDGGNSGAAADEAAGLETGSGAADADAAGGGDDTDTDTSEAAPQSAAADEQERARAGEGRDGAEGADLFAAEHAGFVETMLTTPMPATGALLDAVLELARDPALDESTGAREPGGAGGAAVAGSGSTALAEYRARAAELAPAIERMRALWERVIAERLALRPALSRRPQPEGDELAIEALPGAVAQAFAGVARPLAYRSRVVRPRRTRRAGSTDYVFLVDRSASMQGAIAAAASDAMLIMLEALSGVERDVRHAERAAGSELELDIRTALLVFDAEVAVVKPLSGGIDDAVRRALDAAIRSPRGSTNDGAALRAAAEQLGVAGHASEAPLAAADGVERRRIVILISDGGSNDPVAAARELRALRAAGVLVVGCGFGSDEMTDRYAPDGRRVERPALLAETLHDIIASELP
ncbi:vWA domain-containing protein [Leucobacter luti]|uniref:von Willebrand factor type A domain-containing protein n=1 Tax=Leucobacter luti TaxID=340320 RepID=A0A4Q7TVA0_9MICO|nr:vWA domain-containing protein [Leucobacter luti]MBL3698071.1 VWA domain-containing protein [Leucobacter luti]RZT64845.1 von Willebrand factor type A domain-containing protein [Leucobacter luti]